MLIISLRKLSNTQKNNLKKFYKLLIYDSRLHLRKTISQLVKGCDVVLIELDLSRVFSISRNIVYKWLKQQDIVNIATTFIYESSKYKSLFKDNINFFIRKLPLLFDRELEAVIDDQAYLDQETKSVYHPEPEPVEEDEEAVDGVTGQSMSQRVNPLEPRGGRGSPLQSSLEIIKRIDDIQKQIDAVVERLKRLEDGEPISGEPVTTPVTEDAPTPVARQLQQTRGWKVKQGSKEFIVIESTDGDDKVIKEFPYRNGIEKRKAKKEAEKCLASLSTGK
jgi:hypothetical protein